MSSNIEWALPLPIAKVFSTNFLAVPTLPKFSPTKVLCYTVYFINYSVVGYSVCSMCTLLLNATITATVAIVLPSGF